MGLVIIQFFDQTPTRQTTLHPLRLARSECHPEAAMDTQLNITFSQLAVPVLRLLSGRRSDGTIADRDQDLTTPDRAATGS